MRNARRSMNRALERKFASSANANATSTWSELSLMASRRKRKASSCFFSFCCCSCCIKSVADRTTHMRSGCLASNVRQSLRSFWRSSVLRSSPAGKSTLWRFTSKVVTLYAGDHPEPTLLFHSVCTLAKFPSRSRHSTWQPCNLPDDCT